MENENRSVATTGQENQVSFIPFGAADKIALTLDIIKNIVAVPTKTGKTCTDRDALKFMMLCQAQRLNPFAGDAFLIGYDSQNGPSFSLITAHLAFLKRAQSSEAFDGMESGVIVQSENGNVVEREGDFYLPDEKVLGGWAKVHNKKISHPVYRRIRMERFNNGFAQWKVDAAGMIVKCAEADALRSAFPTLLGGLFTGDEMQNVEVSPVAAMIELPSSETPPAGNRESDSTPRNQSAPAQSGSADGWTVTGVKVKEVRTATGKSGRGPWTAYFVKFTDDTEAGTFSDTQGQIAQGLAGRDETCTVKIKPGKKPGTLELVDIEPDATTPEVMP